MLNYLTHNNVELRASAYMDGAPCIAMFSEDGEPITHVTVNHEDRLPGMLLIKSYSENEGMLEWLIDNDLVLSFEEFDVQSGFVTLHAITVTDKLLSIFNDGDIKDELQMGHSAHKTFNEVMGSSKEDAINLLEAINSPDRINNFVKENIINSKDQDGTCSLMKDVANANEAMARKFNDETPLASKEEIMHVAFAHMATIAFKSQLASMHIKGVPLEEVHDLMTSFKNQVIDAYTQDYNEMSAARKEAMH